MIEMNLKQLGQSISEYIIIVALIAIAGIAIYGLFGDTVRGQMGGMTDELAGQTGGETVEKPGTFTTGETRGLKNFSEGTAK